MFLPIGDDIKTRTFPFINILLIAGNVGAFLYYYGTRPDYPQIVEVHGFTPAHWTWQSIFTSMFLHADPLHLAGNMLFLAIVGDNVEEKYGHLTYAFFYAFCGVAAVFAHALMATADMARIPTIGASGAVSGIMGAYLVLYPFHMMRVLAIVIPIKVPAFVFIGFWVFTQWLIVKAMERGDVTRVAVWAHIGGFAFGFVVTVLMRIAAKRAPTK